jgi:hypothetical protein
MQYYCDNYRHLICLPYSKENLHLMAESLNIGRHYFHRTHYDIPKRRIEEIKAKCIIVASKQIVKIIKS